MKWMQWGGYGLDGAWRNTMRQSFEPYGPGCDNEHKALRDLLEVMFLAERKGSNAPRLSTTVESISALLRFLFAEESPQIEFERQLRRR